MAAQHLLVQLPPNPWLYIYSVASPVHHMLFWFHFSFTRNLEYMLSPLFFELEYMLSWSKGWAPDMLFTVIHVLYLLCGPFGCSSYAKQRHEVTASILHHVLSHKWLAHLFLSCPSSSSTLMLHVLVTFFLVACSVTSSKTKGKCQVILLFTCSHASKFLKSHLKCSKKIWFFLWSSKGMCVQLLRNSKYT